jgi:hypothetical protein
VVLSETRHAEGSFSLPNRLAFFTVQNPGDRATKLNMDYLAKPLLSALPELTPNWDIQAFMAEQASKANLRQLLGGAQTPARTSAASDGPASRVVSMAAGRGNIVRASGGLGEAVTGQARVGSFAATHAL